METRSPLDETGRLPARTGLAHRLSSLVSPDVDDVMRRLEIKHLTRYRYAAPVQFHPHTLLLRPREGHDIRIESSTLAIEPDCLVGWQRDIFGNSLARAEFRERGDVLAIESGVVIAHYGAADLPMEPAAYAVTYPFQYDASERADASPYQMPLFAKDDEALRDWVGEFWTPGVVHPTVDLLDTVNAAIPRRVGYVRREEPGVQRPAETLGHGTGSCRDLATLFIETCRHLGFAARFVSGYLHAPGLDAAEGATHAWGEVYLPGTGWRGFDSTTGERVGGDHIAVAVSRHPESVPPVSGSYSGEVVGFPVMEVEIEVREV